MATIITRAGKGSPLTNNEMDSNLTNLNNGKYETTGGTISGNITATGTISALGSNFIGSGITGTAFLSATGLTTTGGGIACRGSSSGFNPGGIEIYAGGGEVARVVGNGQFRYGDTTTTPTLNVRMAIAYDGGVTQYGIQMKPGGDNTTSIAFKSAADASIGSITQTGVGVAYNTSSDYRLKEQIAPMKCALTVVSRLRPVTYKWKTDGTAGHGFIAHELQEVVPSCVSGEKDAVDEEGRPLYQGIDTGFLIGYLVGAIQELTIRLEELEGK